MSRGASAEPSPAVPEPDAAPCVAVVDDDPRVRDGLDALLASSGYAVALFASTGEFLAALRLASRAAPPRCLVLDIRLRAESGLDFQKHLADAGVAIPVVLITGHGDVPIAVRGMKQGAVDMLPKPFRPDELLSAVAAAVRLDAERRARGAAAADLAARFATLTPREREVVRLVVAGLMNKQVAGRLGLSEVTVKIHRGNAMRKMAAASLPDLVRMTEALGLGTAGVGRFGAGRDGGAAGDPKI